MNPNDGEDFDNWEARRLRTKARVGNGNGFGTPLSIAAQLLPTPSVADATGGHARRGGDRGDELLLPGIAESLNVGTWGEYAKAVARWEAVLGRPAPEPTLPDGKGGKRRLNARLVEWMMGQDDGWVTDPAIGLNRKEQIKALGNGVVTQQAELALDIAWGRILEAVAA
jgi:DNA (cytosine-5)-methyltransferase 1